MDKYIKMTAHFFFINLTFLLLTSTFVSAGAPDTLWTRTYGYAYDDAGYDVKQTSDGGYILVGYATFWWGLYDKESVYLIKTDANGDRLWEETYGGWDSYSHAHEVRQTFDGGYIIAVELDTRQPIALADVWIIKTDSSGATLWQQFYGQVYDEGAFSIQQTTDSGYIVAGYSSSGYDRDSVDVWLLKTNTTGDTVWTKTYGGNARDVAYSVQQTADGGYIVAGNTYSFGTGTPDSANIYVVKTDSLGTIEWDKSWGDNEGDYCREICQTSDGGYIIAGYTNSFGAGGYDVFLIRTEANGATVWTQTYGTSNNEIGRALDLTHDGGFIIAGDDGDVLVIKTDSLGNEEWTKRVGGAGIEYGWSVQQTAEGGYIVAGSTESFGAGGSNVYLIKLKADLGVAEEITHPAKELYHGATIISGPLLLPEGRRYKIFDITGKQVKSHQLKPGIYFLEIDKKIIHKIIKIR